MTHSERTERLYKLNADRKQKRTETIHIIATGFTILLTLSIGYLALVVGALTYIPQ